jgi:hypothetical protein
MKLSKWAFLTIVAVLPAAMVTAPAPAAYARAVASTTVTKLASDLVTATKGAIDASTESTRQSAVEGALIGVFDSQQPSGADANAALNIAEASLKKSNLWTTAVQKAFATARAAAAKLVTPTAGGAPGGGVDLGVPPSNTGGGGTQTATYGAT